MYEYLKGKLTQISNATTILEANNIGYRIHTPSNLLEQTIGKEIILYTSLVVKEESHTLYGFLTVLERDLFEKLITISGIGPKTGLALISHIDLEHFESAIQSDDIRLISKVPGIGKKTAQRLIIEMRDKFKFTHKTASNTQPSIMLDAISALTNLGYSSIQAQIAVKKAIKETGEKTNISKLISLALKLG